MLRQRPGRTSVRALAEALPLANQSVDAAMAILTVHHWSDMERGIRELQRVAAHRLVVLTYVPHLAEEFWLTQDYLPELGSEDDARFPSIDDLLPMFSGSANVSTVPVPADCADGFFEAYWARPKAYLDAAVRANMSSFWLSTQSEISDGLERLESDLAVGEWHRKWGHLLAHDSLDLGYRLIVSNELSEERG
jgi:hypothetical protein